MTVKTDNAAEVGMHIFERANLGKAPFRCVGMSEMSIRHPDGSTQASGSCDYCSTGIRYAYHIRGADGRTFKVGCDCVLKTEEAGLIQSYKNRPEVRAMARAKVQAKNDRVTNEWKALMSDEGNRAKLAAMPADYGKTQLERLEWIYRNCGAAGRGRWLKVLKTTLASAPAATQEMETA